MQKCPIEGIVPLEMGDFSGKSGSTMLYFSGKQRVLLLGLGEKESCDVKAAYGAAVLRCDQKPWKKVVFGMAGNALDAVKGVMTALYGFDRYREKKEKIFSEAVFLGADKSLIEACETLFLGVNRTRDLVNSNADDVNPSAFAGQIEAVAKENGLKCRVMRMAELQKEGLHLIEAVGKGARDEPAFVILEYDGGGKSIAIVGKGVTYDTGGLSIKPSNGMLEMKGDMAGAAAILGAMEVIAKLKLKVKVTALFCIAENAVGSGSFKVGDCYPSYAGKHVEIINTDAEGRLVMADGLAYACDKIKPDVLLDIATLTGAVEVALGSHRAGVFTESDELAGALENASKVSGEKIWRMPFDFTYGEALKSDIADIKNLGTRKGSAIIAGRFLAAFVEKGVSFAHIDIAGMTFVEKPKGIYRTHATGYGVQLLVELARNYATKG